MLATSIRSEETGGVGFDSSSSADTSQLRHAQDPEFGSNSAHEPYPNGRFSDVEKFIGTEVRDRRNHSN